MKKKILVVEDSLLIANALKILLEAEGYDVIHVPLSQLTNTALEETELSAKEKARCKNFFALGMMYWLFDRSVKETERFLDSKFKKTPVLAEANKKAMYAGYHYAETVEALPSSLPVRCVVPSPPVRFPAGSGVCL